MSGPLLRALLVAAALAAPAAAQPVLLPLLENGPTAERVNVVLVAEGYTAAQRGRFEADAARIAGALLATPPYSDYRAFFNAYAVAVASAESGADHPSRGVYRDTYFDAAYDCAGIERLICLGGEGRLDTVLRDVFPEYDVVLVVVNDPEYGGSGGRFAVASTHGAAAEIAVHEVGHSFAGLSDEYGGTGRGFDSWNTTTTTDRARVPWRVWVEDETPLPTPDADAYTGVVGLFEGAAYADFGAYRPERFCKMRALGDPFCAVCTERHVGAVYGLVSPIASAEPAGPDVEVGDGDRLALRVEPLVPEDRLAVEWTVDGLCGRGRRPGPHARRRGPPARPLPRRGPRERHDGPGPRPRAPPAPQRRPGLDRHAHGADGGRERGRRGRPPGPGGPEPRRPPGPRHVLARRAGPDPAGRLRRARPARSPSSPTGRARRGPTRRRGPRRGSRPASTPSASTPPGRTLTRRMTVVR